MKQRLEIRDPVEAQAFAMKERGRDGLQEAVRQLVLGLAISEPLCAKALGYHVQDSRKTPPGYPDCEIVLPAQSRLIKAELKAERERPTFDQAMWLNRLSMVPGVEVYLWRPTHLLRGEIWETLRNPENAGKWGAWLHSEGVPGDPYSNPRGNR